MLIYFLIKCYIKHYFRNLFYKLIHICTYAYLDGLLNASAAQNHETGGRIEQERDQEPSIRHSHSHFKHHAHDRRISRHF